MKSFLISLTLASVVCMTPIAVMGQRELTFNASTGKFKIAQFSDTHYIYGNDKAKAALDCLGETIDAEQPDLVIITGDVIFGKPADKSLRAVLDVVSMRKTPFIVTFGNHDDESGLSREQLFSIIRSYPTNITFDAEGVSGVGNCSFPVKDKNGKAEAVIYCFDSGAYSEMEDAKGYDHIKFDQIAWYRDLSATYRKGNGGYPVPSLAFFHIPTPEYAYAASDEKVIMRGTRAEHACPPEINSGLFASMKEMEDVRAIFVGHDHDNDYAALYKGILLAYGRYSGGNTVYNNLKPNGARIIELTEGKEGFTTWIRLSGGKVLQTLSYPDDFRKAKED
jgi:3',5'-cyclic AMP phosphodiesterase CpdA